MFGCFGCGSAKHQFVTEPKDTKKHVHKKTAKESSSEEESSGSDEDSSEDSDEKSGSDDGTRSFLDADDQRSEISGAESATVDALVSCDVFLVIFRFLHFDSSPVFVSQQIYNTHTTVRFENDMKYTPDTGSKGKRSPINSAEIPNSRALSQKLLMEEDDGPPRPGRLEKSRAVSQNYIGGAPAPDKQKAPEQKLPANLNAIPNPGPSPKATTSPPISGVNTSGKTLTKKISSYENFKRTHPHLFPDPTSSDVRNRMQQYVPHHSLTEEEAMQLNRVLQIQESRHGINMFKALDLIQDQPEIETLMRMGRRYEDSVLFIFERKIATNSIPLHRRSPSSRQPSPSAQSHYISSNMSVGSMNSNAGMGVAPSHRLPTPPHSPAQLHQHGMAAATPSPTNQYYPSNTPVFQFPNSYTPPPVSYTNPTRPMPYPVTPYQNGNSNMSVSSVASTGSYLPYPHPTPPQPQYVNVQRMQQQDALMMQQQQYLQFQQQAQAQAQGRRPMSPPDRYQQAPMTPPQQYSPPNRMVRKFHASTTFFLFFF